MILCPFTNMPCPNHPVIHVTEIENGKAHLTHMCEKCGTNFLNSKEIFPHKPIKIIKTADELFDLFIGKGIKVEKPKIIKRDPCPQCGLTLKQFNETGKFGCHFCYTHYREEFNAIAPILHNNKLSKLKHVGKKPKNYIKGLEIIEQIKILKLKLAKAIELENYEEASQIKIEIEKLNGT